MFIEEKEKGGDRKTHLRGERKRGGV